MARLIPRGSSLWPDIGPEPAADIIQRYKQQWVGAWKDPDEDDRLREYISSLGEPIHFADAAGLYGYTENGAGKLVIPFRFAEHYFPGCWPGAAQERGDCVSHSSKNSALVTFASEIAFGQPDQESGAVEVVPELPSAGVKEGAFSSESVYWWRGYNGDGWSCSTGSLMLVRHGILARKNYPSLNLDMTEYSGRLAGLYGSRQPTAEIDAEMKLHSFRTVAEASTFEEIRDALAAGFGLSSCGGEGYASTRDPNGVSLRRGNWAHAMAIIGADDRASTKAIYNEPLVLIMNSWGPWNDGPRRIRGTNIDIPEGSFWTPWSHCRNRDFHVISGARGWRREKLPPFHIGIAA